MKNSIIQATVPELAPAMPNDLSAKLDLIIELLTKQQSSTPELMTQKEVMKFLRRTKPVVISYHKKGIITPYRIPGQRSTFYLRSEIENLFNSQKH